MSYTNVHIPDRFSTQTQLREKVHELNSKIDWLNQMLDSYEKELQNIPKAILEYGFVELNYENKKMRVGEIP